MDQDKKIDQACETGEVFTKLYYESLDKKRYHISRLYLDTAQLVWNGNPIKGNEPIQKFWMDLPPSKHTITTLDAQPILVPTGSDQLTVLVRVSGQVRYLDKISKQFTQTFTLAAIGDKWKIVNDTFRMQHSSSSIS